MTLQQLEYIIALDSHRNFVRAANHCLVTQPTLTMQVHKLEEEVGFRIFDRSRKPLQPTRLGLQFIERSRIILKEVQALKALVSEDIESVEGEFTLGIIPTLAPYLLPLFLGAFSKQFPKTRLLIEELQSEVIIERLKKDQLNMAILATPLNESYLREIPLFNEPFLAYVPEGHELQSQGKVETGKLSGKSLLLLDEGHCFREQALNLCDLRAEEDDLPFEYQTGSIETLMKLVDQGLGYTLIPEMAVTGIAAQQSRILRFSEPEPIREISLVCSSAFSRERLLEVLRQAVLGSIPAHFKKSGHYFRVKWR